MSVPAVRVPVAGTRRDALLPLSAPLALAAAVAASVAVRSLLAGRTASPWIFPDELIYSELAQSLAWLGEPSLRGALSLQYGLGYPVLLAPAYRLAGDPVLGYELVKLTNAVVMSLAAVPVYLLARRVLEPWPSVLVAALSLAIPSYAYTGLVLTENAFYPVFLVAVLAMVRALERPSVGRQAAVLAAVAAAFAVRAQGIVLVPAFLAAMVATAGLDARRDGTLTPRALLARLDRFRPTWIVLAVSVVGLVAVQAVRGGSPAAVLGVYAVVAENVSLGGLLQWLVYHAGELDLYLGIVPFAASVVVAAVALRDRFAPREVQIGVVASACVVLAMLVVVSAVSSEAYAGDATPARLRERNLFHVAPLFLVGFVYWLRAGGPRLRGPALAAAGLAAVLPMTVPYGSSFVHASFQALAVTPWALLGSRGAVMGASVFAAAAAVLFSVVPPSRRPALVALVTANFLVVSFVAAKTLEVASEQTRARTLAAAPADWIDRATAGRPVTAVWAADRRSRAETHWAERAIWLGELFNRSVTAVHHLGQPMRYGLPGVQLARRPDGTVVGAAHGVPLASADVLAPCTLGVRGRLVAVDGSARLGLYRVAGPLRVGNGEGAAACAGTR